VTENQGYGADPADMAFQCELWAARAARDYDGFIVVEFPQQWLLSGVRLLTLAVPASRTVITVSTSVDGATFSRRAELHDTIPVSGVNKQETLTFTTVAANYLRIDIDNASNVMTSSWATLGHVEVLTQPNTARSC
jgi:hypothetical protein